MYDFSPIIAYLMFLKHQCGLFVSLHPTYGFPTEKLRAFNFHENPYCAYIKGNAQAAAHCIACQKKVAEKCKNGPYNGVCFAGVKERIYPIQSKTEVVGFISVSGYQTEHPDSYLTRIRQIYGLDPGGLKKRYKLLNPVFPEPDTLDTLLLPLCQMLELSYLKNDHPSPEKSLTDKVLLFIRENRNQPITSEDICQHFYCSRSFMSTQFNKETGKSIRDYINELRIDDAKKLLTDSSLSVTEIAFLIGFDSPNYFSQIFKKQMGMSPLKYRKEKL